jgi:hypothetical protein
MPDAVSTLLNCLRTEIGPLGNLLILRRFDDAYILQRKRHRVLLSANPYNFGGVITTLETDTYMPYLFYRQRGPSPMTLSMNSVPIS